MNKLLQEKNNNSNIEDSAQNYVQI